MDFISVVHIIIKAFMRRCDSKDENCTLSIYCKFCEGRKHAFHLDSVCCFYTCRFPESAVERRTSKRNEGKSLLRKQTNKNCLKLFMFRNSTSVVTLNII